MDEKNLRRVTDFLQQLQSEIIAAFSSQDSQLAHREDTWSRAEGGGGRTYLLENGSHIEKAGINYSDVHGTALPQSASAQRPELAKSFRLWGLVVIHPETLHPDQPYERTFFCAQLRIKMRSGGLAAALILPPHKEDAIHWHRTGNPLCSFQ